MIKLTGPWDDGYAIHTYNNPEGGRTLLGEAVYRYIYRKQWCLIDSLARWAQSIIQAQQEFKNCGLLLGIPSSRSLSDYDPISLLVDWISQLTTLPRAVGALARYGMISEYSDSAIIDDRRGGFTVTASEAIRGRDILIVDGILCSGNTSSLAVNALRDAGARSVKLLVFTQIQRQSIDTYGLTRD